MGFPNDNSRDFLKTWTPDEDKFPQISDKACDQARYSRYINSSVEDASKPNVEKKNSGGFSLLYLNSSGGVT